MQDTSRSRSRYTQRVRIERRAAAEAEWFYGTLGGQVPADASTEEGRAARRIDGWLKELPPFHRGAFALRHTPRAWPPCLTEEFGNEASLIVRLECALHPAVGKSTADLEAASVERLTAIITAASAERSRRSGTRRDARTGRHEIQLAHLVIRADKHFESATRAFAKVRGDEPCLVPNWVDEGEDEEDDECV